jgi:EAL domain-containing protein (putative c-di-GMP-specific phosphodiesterase class I)
VPPGEFIPVAETTGLIHPLTERVLDLTLAQARAWSDVGLTVPVAVNLSARCLHDSELPLRVLTALQRHRVPAGQLCLEITESAIMRDPAGALVILRDLADAGISLSLDDFGTGYSSMTYLRHLPVAELKVDQSFVQDLIAKRADTVLVRSAVDLGHNLGLSVVAEGVEDAPTLDVLRELGCDIAQGYYIARPMPARDLETWLSTAHPCGRAVPAAAASRLVGAQRA